MLSMCCDHVLFLLLFLIMSNFLCVCVWVGAWMHTFSVAEFVTGFVSKSSESESTSQSMPDTVSVNVTIRGHQVQLALKLDQHANTDFPFYVFTRNKDRQLETKRVNRTKQKVCISIRKYRTLYKKTNLSQNYCSTWMVMWIQFAKSNIFNANVTI